MSIPRHMVWRQENRTSGAKAKLLMVLYGTAEAVPFRSLMFRDGC
jgi:hypothetical protein